MPRKARINAPGALHHISDFVETVLKAAQENSDRKSRLQAAEYSFDWLVGRVARQLEIEPKNGCPPNLHRDRSRRKIDSLSVYADLICHPDYHCIGHAGCSG
jgi:hypothetical protein